MKLNRVVIYAQDIQLITGRSERSAQRILQNIKKKLGKEKYQFVTFEEYSKHSGISLQKLDEYLK